jgi:Beta propeller domain
MTRLTLVMLMSISGLLAAGCGGSSSGPAQDGSDPPAVGALRAVTDAAELEVSLKSAYTTLQANDGGTQTTGTNSGPDTNATFTGTYTQEPNVDEFDVVRYDGAYLYIAPRRFVQCCLLAQTQTASRHPPTPRHTIRILSTDPAQASASAVSEIPLDEDVSVQGLYLGDGRLFALTSKSFWGGYGEYWASIRIWTPEQLGFRLYHTSDPAAPTLEVEAIIDGVFVESRRVGNTVYIVSRYTPSIDGLVYPVITPAQQSDNQAILADVTLDQLLPRIVINGVSRPLIDPERCYITNDEQGAGYPVITSITAVPLGDPMAFQSTCYDEEAYGAYTSGTAIYLTQERSDADSGRLFTRIHKFAFDGDSVRYRGSGDVAGQLWRGGQADFRMNEYDGDLRVFTSEFDRTSDDFVDHRLFVLRESPDAPRLDIVSELPNAMHPEEIGKPNEAMFGVRFLADRVYAVTFEQLDPLYVIDLSDPADPRLAAELEIPGVIDFLHPVSDDLLLGLGLVATGGVRLELFDVSDLHQPQSRGSIVLGGLGSYSEAVVDRHAFTYQPDVDGIDRFTIPADLYAADTSDFVEAGLYLYEIRDKATPALATLNAAGALITNRAGDGQPAYTAERNRAFIHGNTVYYVRDDDVWAAFWNAPSLPAGPF